MVLPCAATMAAEFFITRRFFFGSHGCLNMRVKIDKNQPKLTQDLPEF